jgi:hypothetical protein
MHKTSNNVVRRVLPLLVVVLSAACAEVEAEIPEAQVTQKNILFQGMGDLGALVGEVSATQTFTLTSANLSWVKDLDSKIYVTQIDLKARSGIEDLGFIRYAHVSMSDFDSKWQSVEVLDYTRPEDQAPTTVLSAKTLYPIDITQVWKAKKVLVTISLAGVLPDKAWTGEVTLHLSGKISYKL